MIMRELSHRTKNVLAVVQVMTWQTSSMDLDPKDFAERLTQRIDALVRSHDLLTKGEWQGVSLEELIRSQIAPFLDRDNERLAIDGPALHLQPDAAQTMGLALHELGTNATKYGALSCPTGRIEIEWTIEPDVLASRRFHMEWREFGGPEVNRPNTKGYGSTIIKNVIEAGFDGEVVLEFTPHGFTWQLTASTDHMFVVERRPTDSTPVEANS
jgi:two-component sensor histidine kinase